MTKKDLIEIKEEANKINNYFNKIMKELVRKNKNIKKYDEINGDFTYKNQEYIILGGFHDIRKNAEDNILIENFFIIEDITKSSSTAPEIEKIIKELEKIKEEKIASFIIVTDYPEELKKEEEYKNEYILTKEEAIKYMNKFKNIIKILKKELNKTVSKKLKFT